MPAAYPRAKSSLKTRGENFCRGKLHLRMPPVAPAPTCLEAFLLFVWRTFSLVDSPGADFPGNLFGSFFRQICPLAQFRPERPEPAYFLSLAFSSPTPSVRDVPNFKLYRLDGPRPRYGQVNLVVSTPKRPSGHETVGFGILPGRHWGETSFTCFDT